MTAVLPFPAASLDLDAEQIQRAVLFQRRFGLTMLHRREEPERSEPGTAATVGGTRWDRESLTASAASAFRTAGQWMLYLDPPEAGPDLAAAGRLFSELGEPFGSYLMLVAGDQDADQPAHLVELIDELLDIELQPPRERPHTGLPRNLRYSQQHAYLMLASCGSPWIREYRYDALAELLAESPDREGVAPVGALGTPPRRIWTLASGLLTRDDDLQRALGNDLAAMCVHYREAMELGRTNSYLWRNAAAPVEVGDIDIAGIACLAARQIGADTVDAALTDGPFGAALDEIAMGPVMAGLALAEPERAHRWNRW